MVGTRSLLVFGVLAQASAFSTLTKLPGLRCSPAARCSRELGMRLRMQEKEDGTTMKQYAINLEGHFKPNVGFVPHAWKTDGDFASGDPKYALKYDTATGGATTSVEIYGVGPTYEDFVAGFTPQSDPGWSVEPADGCLDIKGGDSDVLQVKYTGECEGPKFGTLVAVIPSENHSFTFKFRVEP